MKLNILEVTTILLMSILKGTDEYGQFNASRREYRIPVINKIFDNHDLIMEGSSS